MTVSIMGGFFFFMGGSVNQLSFRICGTSCSRKVVGKNVHAAIPKGTVSDTVAVEPSLSFSTCKHTSIAS